MGMVLYKRVDSCFRMIKICSKELDRTFISQRRRTMNLVRWNPFSEMSLLQNQMNRLFDSALHGWQGEGDGTIGTTGWVPAADICESDNELIVNLDLPGVDPKMVDVRVENNVLTIRGERKFAE